MRSIFPLRARRFWLVSFVFLLLSSWGFAAALKTVQVVDKDHFTRVLFTLDKTFNYHYFAMTDPNRLVVDFSGVHSELTKSKLSPKNQLIRHIRIGKHKHQLRVVLDLKQKQYPVIYKTKPHHLIIDFYNSKTKRAKKIVARHPYLTASEVNKHTKHHQAVVVIDPGHGGKDPGATGPKGIHEKNVVLAISKDLKNDLKQFHLLKVAMTRTGDYFVTLRGRLNVARKDKADAFMAIHADSFKYKSARGASVFALSKHGATSEAAHWLAHSENHAVLAGADFKTRSHALQSVLLNLSQSVTIQDSLVFGSDVVHQLEQVTDMHSHRVEQAPFVVLKSPDIPSLLVETGFISNPQEEKRLNSSSYQHRLAHALMSGILHYLYSYPPHDSYIALQQAGRYFIKVKSGQTLGGIAHAYWTTVAAIKKANQLKSSQIKPGQVLKIPPAKV